MSWITVIWSMVAGASLTMALPHLFVAAKSKRRAVNVFFVLAAIAVAAMATVEISMMHAQTPAESGRALQWAHVPVFVLVVSIVGFVRCYFGTGRIWLGVAACIARFVTLVINFAMPPNVNFREITALHRFEFLGEVIALPVGELSPWTRLAQLSSLLLLAFVIDAAVALWRCGGQDDRRRAIVVGGGISLFIVFAAGISALILDRVIEWPCFVSFSFLAIIAAMAFELGQDLLRSARFAGQLRESEAALRESEQRMELAVIAGGLGLWIWEIPHRQVWATGKARSLFGVDADAELDFEGLTAFVHPDDRAALRAATAKAFADAGDFQCECRIVSLPARWVISRGRIEFDGERKPVRMRAVTVDVTDRKQAETELRQSREELYHVGRVALMGELAASLAHELNQPLAGIVANAQAGRRLLNRTPPDLAEFREILQDIADDGKRAGEVIRSLRNMIARGQLDWECLDINELVAKGARLVTPDGIARGCAIELSLAENLPRVHAVRVQLKQVLINLIVNAFDAMDGAEAARKRVILATARDGENLRISVRDFGTGLPEQSDIFEPFFSTKREGLGMGLRIAQSIAKAHGGMLWAENAPEGGACFHLTLPLHRMPADDSPSVPGLSGR